MTAHVVLICDVDNTVYNFVDFYGKAFRAMVNVVSKGTEESPETIVRQFSEIIAVAGSLDFRNLIQNLDASKRMDAASREVLVRHGRRAFDLSKRKQLKAYDGMNQTLKAISSAGVTIVGATNAPFYHAYSRLRDVGSLPLFSGLFAWEGVKLDFDHHLFDQALHVSHEHLIELAKRTLRHIEVFPKNLTKPNLFSYERIQRIFGAGADYYVIGDSISKDLAPAHTLGMKTIWAKYGTTVDERNLQTILSITPWTASEISFHSEESFLPDYVVESPREILRILPHQLELFF